MMYFKPDLVFSSALNSRKTFYVCLPEDYEQTDKRYPVVYMLHGRSGSETDWIYKGGIVDTASKLVSEGKLQDCIIVMPSDGGHDRGTFYVDWYDGSGNFEQYIMYDLIPYVDMQYRTITGRESRVIGGLSMGGFGAFMLALKHPDTFAAAASLSGALGSVKHFDPLESMRMAGPAHGPYAKQYDLVELAADRVSHSMRPRLYFNCGTEDYLYELNLGYKQLLEKLGYPFDFETFPGEHQWDYWKAHVDKVLIYFNKKKI